MNRDGTVTVLRWPSPSYYDQVRYKTSDRDLPRLGAAEDEGMFLGLSVEIDDGRRTTWLRDWDSEQRHGDGWTDEVVTTYTDGELGLEVEVRDVVGHPDDTLARQVTVERLEGSSVRDASLLFFENLSLVVSKLATLPVQDWCFESQNTDTARYEADLDALVHEKEARRVDR
ncbi:MAG: hypothetical protein U5R31_07205 [Acidimicrobiia bacterium]|nr:hypothetical protein [Acidimicrobiia bacterium]